MTHHRFTTSKPDASIYPRQKRWNDWGHGPLADDAPVTGVLRWAVGGLICGVLTFLAFVYAVGPVGA